MGVENGVSLFAIVANLGHGLAHDLLVIELGIGRNLTGQRDVIALHERLASHTGSGILGKTGIEHAIGNEVRHLVRMTLANGLTGKLKSLEHWPSIGIETKNSSKSIKLS